MRIAHILETLALLAASASAANFVEIGLQKLPPGQPGLPRLSRRASPGAYLENLVNNVTGGGYYANVTVGTPPQPQLLVVDTGSSDIWVVASDADLCTSTRLQQSYGDSCGETYDKTASSTYKLISSAGFEISYLDGSGSSGDYISDTFGIAGTSIKSLQLGYATEVVRGTGIMGVSYSSAESAIEEYPNLLDQFKSQGLIATKAFSLYLNDYRSQTGSILFGGVDTDKFIGNLTALPILQTLTQAGNTTYSVLAVALGSMTATTDTKQAIDFGGTSVPAILDSGTTLSYLPSDIASSLFDAVGAYTDNEETGYTFVDCETTDLTLTFTFSRGVTIAVPASQIVLDVFSEVQDEIPPNVPFSNACLFGFQDIRSTSSSSYKLSAKIVAAVTSDSYALLGDTFLRSAYAVYDMTNNEIALAQANLNSTTSNVVEFQASDSGIPALTGVKSQQASSPTATTTGSGSSSGGSGSSSGSTGAGTVTVTASASSSKSGAGPSPAHGPSSGLLAAAALSCLFSFLGGVFIVA